MTNNTHQVAMPKNYAGFLWHVLYQHRWRCIASLCLAMAWPVGAIVYPNIVGNFTEIFKQNADALAWSDISTAFLMMVGLWLYETIAWRSFGFNESFNKPAIEVTARRHIYDYALDHSYRYYTDNFPGSVANKINDISRGSLFLWGHVSGYYLPAIIACIATSAYLWHKVDAIMMGICTVWIAGYIFVTYMAAKKNRAFAIEYSENRSVLSGQMVDTLGNHLNFRLFSRKAFELGLFQKQQDIVKQAFHKNMYIIEWEKLIKGIWTIVMVLGGMIGYALYMVLYGHISSGSFITVFLISMNLSETVFHLGQHFPELVREWGTCEQAFSVIKEPYEVKNRKGALPLEVTNGSIDVQDLEFSYNDRIKIFDKLSLSIKPGEKIGLVGFSGSGKTSFINLLLRHFDYQNGKILVDGQNIQEVQQESLREKISMIPQDTSLFHRKLIDNVRYGRLDATDAEVVDACKKAYAHEFIENLDEGYETIVGERGVKLSGGQRQRIAIARAILKDAPILVLDESTSALDSVTEKCIQESMYELMLGRTTIIVAHRLSTLAEVDRIIVFDKGKIIEQGTHKELVEHENGHYRMMWDMQAGGFLPKSEDGHEGEEEAS